MMIQEAQTPGNEKGKDTVSIFDLIATLLRRRWLIIGITLGAAVLTVAFSLLSLHLPPNSPWNRLPNIYAAKVKVLLQQIGSSGKTTSLGSTGGTLSLLLGGTPVKDINIILAEQLLKGNTIQDTIAQDFNFYEKYKLREAKYPKTTARKIFSGAMKLEYGAGETGNILILSYENTDPQFSYRVVTRVAELLEQRFRELTLERVLRKKQFIEERLRTVEQDLLNAQKSLTEFQREFGVMDVSAQLQQQSSLITSLKTEILKSQMELQSLRDYLPENDPRIVRLSQEIENKNKFIENLRTGSAELVGRELSPNTIPSVLTRYLNLQGELDVQTAVYRTLRQEYESVKIDEADNSKTFQVIEPAEVPEVKSRPARSLLCALVTVTAFFLSIFLVLILDYVERARRNPVEAEKLSQIRRMVSFRRRSRPTNAQR